jgi:SAM-dependent methyltransferase
MLTIDRRTIRRHGPGSLLAVCWRQWRTERLLARRGVRFRTTDPEMLQAAYAAMSEREFDAINGPQQWASWRTIPRAMSGQVPDRPLRVLDLGCGAGSSTQVLAFYCPAGSRITGYEIVQPLLDIARRRRYQHQTGLPAEVAFRCQGIAESLCAPEGTPLAEHSVDLVNASGVVGHHLNAQTVLPLVQELRRVLRPEGVAMLDVGPTLRAPALIEVMTRAGFQSLQHARSCFLDPTGQVVFRSPKAVK